MVGSIKATIGAIKAMIPNSDATTIHKVGIMVYKDVIADLRQRPIVSKHGRQNRRMFSKGWKQPGKHIQAFLLP